MRKKTIIKILYAIVSSLFVGTYLLYGFDLMTLGDAIINLIYFGILTIIALIIFIDVKNSEDKKSK